MNKLFEYILKEDNKECDLKDFIEKERQPNGLLSDAEDRSSFIEWYLEVHKPEDKGPYCWWLAQYDEWLEHNGLDENDEPNEDEFSVQVEDDDGNYGIISFYNDGSHWTGHISKEESDEDFDRNCCSRLNYMGYLKPKDIVSWLSQDGLRPRILEGKKDMNNKLFESILKEDKMNEVSDMKFYVFAYDSASNDCIWNDPKAFVSFLNSSLESDYNFETWGDIKKNWNWISHDTADSYTLVTDVKEWVTKNLDLSTCPNSHVNRVFMDDDMNLMVEIGSNYDDVKELSQFKPGLWEFKFKKIDGVAASPLIDYTLPDYISKNPTSVNELY